MSAHTLASQTLSNCNLRITLESIVILLGNCTPCVEDEERMVFKGRRCHFIYTPTDVVTDTLSPSPPPPFLYPHTLRPSISSRITFALRVLRH